MRYEFITDTLSSTSRIEVDVISDIKLKVGVLIDLIANGIP